MTFYKTMHVPLLLYGGELRVPNKKISIRTQSVEMTKLRGTTGCTKKKTRKEMKVSIVNCRYILLLSMLLISRSWDL